MSIHYNAFISYRHSPVDSKVAAEIQRRLEHFPVPRAIRKKTGIQKIDRIFRDKEELPITSDLNDDITDALANSDYLIVICSPRTGESVWVEREIETFLKTHTRRQVLTILAEGEPPDIIPEILRYEETVDPATGQVHRAMMEPLSCDWRVPAHQARREELPRLAAAILGCTYDELRQRQRQYRLRRITAALSLALAASICLSAYVIRTGMLIRENYLQSLRNESRYLAAAASEQLEAGDRITSILLALEALPGEGDDRPVVTQAEYALGQAVNAYVTDSDSPVATGAFAPDGDPREFLTDDSGATLCILDDMDLITLWDTDTVQRTQTIDPELDVNGMLLAGDQRLVVWGDASVLCYDCATGERLWASARNVYSVLLTPDAAQLVVIGHSADWLEDSDFICLLDVETGVETERFVLPPLSEENPAPYVVEQEEGEFSQDGTKLLLPVYSDSSYSICLFDLEQGTGFYLGQSFDYLADFCFLPAGDVIAVGNLEEATSSYGYYDYIDLVESHTGVLKLSGTTGEVLWSSELTYYQIDYQTQLSLCNGGTEVLCTVANVCQRMDCATGAVLARCEATAPILDVTVGDGRALFILQDGTLAVYYFEENRCSGIPKLTGNLIQAERVYGPDDYSWFFVLPAYSAQVLMYRYGVVDDSWVDLDTDVTFSYVRQSMLSDEFATLLDREDQLYLFDLVRRTLVGKADLSVEEGSVTYDMLGYSDDGQYVWVFREESYSYPAALLTIDTSDGTARVEEMPTELGEEVYNQTGSACLWDGKLAYALRSWGQGAAIAVVSLTDGTLEHTISVWEDDTRPTRLYPYQDRMLVVGEDGRCVVLSCEDGTMMALDQALAPDDYSLTQLAAWSPVGGLCAGVGEGRIWLWNGDGALAGEISLENREGVGLSFSPDGEEVLLLCTDGYLYRWRLDGTFLSKTAIGAYLNASSSRGVVWSFSDEAADLAIWTDDNVLNLVSTEDWSVSACATNCLGYLPGQELLLCCRPVQDGRYRLCSYHRYSVPELVERGRAIVGDSTLTEAVKSEYGLN